jgi:hypothetical protein
MATELAARPSLLDNRTTYIRPWSLSAAVPASDLVTSDNYLISCNFGFANRSSNQAGTSTSWYVAVAGAYL